MTGPGAGPFPVQREREPDHRRERPGDRLRADRTELLLAGLLLAAPSAAGTDGYDASASSGSNLGPTSQKLRDRITADIARLREENSDGNGPIPAELVTASASGLDPHSRRRRRSGRSRASRVPAAWRRSASATLVEANIEGRTFGILGEPRVNVLQLNLALDRQFGRTS